MIFLPLAVAGRVALGAALTSPAIVSTPEPTATNYWSLSATGWGITAANVQNCTVSFGTNVYLADTNLSGMVLATMTNTAGARFSGTVAIPAGGGGGIPTLDVTHYGAVGDAIWTIATCTSNSQSVALLTTNSTAATGKLIVIFKGGPHTDIQRVIYLTGTTNALTFTNATESVARTNIWKGWVSTPATTNALTCSGLTVNAIAANIVSSNTYPWFETNTASVVAYMFRSGGAGTVAGHWDLGVLDTVSNISYTIGTSPSQTISETDPTLHTWNVTVSVDFIPTNLSSLVSSFIVDQAGTGGASLLICSGNNNTNNWTGYSTFMQPYDNQDYIGWITNIVNGTNLTLAWPTMNAGQLDTRMGTYSTPGIQAAINAVSAQANVYLPYGLTGKYLTCGKELTNATVGALGIYNATTNLYLADKHIRFYADDTNTAIVGNGAWRLAADNQAVRGQLFSAAGPWTAGKEVVFENLTLDGGVKVGFYTNGVQSYQGFPASVIDGSGFDTSHDAFMIAWGTPLPDAIRFRGVLVEHLRGENVKWAGCCADGWVEISNSEFWDSCASFINFGCSHGYTNNFFHDGYMVEEYYQGYSVGASYFVGNRITNVVTALVIVGAETVNPLGYYSISNNLISAPTGIQMSPARGVTVSSNQFWSTIPVFVTVAGYQGTDHNRNITVVSNVFNGAYDAVGLAGSGVNWASDWTIRGNTHSGGGGWFVSAEIGTVSNILVEANTTTGSFASDVVGPGVVQYLFLTNNNFVTLEGHVLTGDNATNAFDYSSHSEAWCWSHPALTNTAFAVTVLTNSMAHGMRLKLDANPTTSPFTFYLNEYKTSDAYTGTTTNIYWWSTNTTPASWVKL